MTKAATPYLHLHQRKRTWTPVQVSAGTLLTGGEEVVQRALAVSCCNLMLKMKKTMISRLTSRLKHTKFQLNLRKRLRTFAKRGLNLIDTPSSRRSFLRDQSSLYSSQSSVFLETLDCVQQVPTSQEMSRPMSRPIHSSAKRLTCKLTRPSTIFAALRLTGPYKASKQKAITAICPATSGLIVQTISITEGKLAA